MVIGLAHGGISTRDMEKSIDFYIFNVCFRLLQYVDLLYNRQKCIF